MIIETQNSLPNMHTPEKNAILFSLNLILIPFLSYLECSPMVTLPITDADGAMKLLAPDKAGETPFTETIRDEGTKRSVYFATSIPAPILSSAALMLLLLLLLLLIDVKKGKELKIN